MRHQSLFSRDTSDEIRRAPARRPLEIHDSAFLLPSALEIAIATRRTVYDSLYLALAVELGATVVTADRRWTHALKPGPFARFLRPLTPR